MVETVKKIKPTTKQRQFIGEVMSMAQKTIQVLVQRQKTHTKYHKHYFESKKYAVHDELGLAKIGDKVEFKECRPLSKMKKWRLIKVLN